MTTCGNREEGVAGSRGGGAEIRRNVGTRAVRTEADVGLKMR